MICSCYKMLPENEDQAFLNQSKNCKYIIPTDTKTWKSEDTYEKSKIYPVLSTNGSDFEGLVSEKDKEESAEDGKTANGNPKVGSRGGILTRENTIVPGCANCGNGGRLISCAKVNWTPVMCWNRSSKKPSKKMFTLLAVLSILSFIGIIIIFFTDLFNNTILTNLVIKNTSSSFDLWKNPPVHPLMKVYIFNYTNIDEVIANESIKFHVKDVGPYVYRESIYRVNEVFHSNGTVTFQEKKSYQFVPELSIGNQYDKVVVPNIPLILAMAKMRDSYHFAQIGGWALLKAVDRSPFKTLPVDRFLWGYDDKIISIVKPFLKISGQFSYDQFGLLISKNDTSKDRVTVNTGEYDLNKIGLIEKYNGVSHLSHWGTAECNRVDASDGSMFPVSMVQSNETLYIFNRELCRRYPFVFEKKVQILNGIPALRYKPIPNVFDDPISNPENQCYCHMDTGNCPPKGIFNSSPCAFGAPVFASFPHFYLGDPELLNTMDGLHPEAEKHKSYIDIHPDLGFLIATSSKTQINIQIRRAEMITDFKYLTDDLYLPVAWLEITLDDLPAQLKTMIYHGTFSTHQIQLFLMAVFIVTFIVSFIFLIIALRVICTMKCQKKATETFMQR